MFKKVVKKSITSNCGVFLLFAVLSIIYIFPLLRTGHVYYGDDILYHLDRINELVQNIRHNNWYPFFYSFNFDKVNFPLGLFYPQVTLIPFAVFVIITGSYVKGIYCALGVLVFIALGSSYIVGRKFWHHRTPAFFTAIIYGFGLYFSIDMITRADYGEACAMAFFPLALYGFYAILRGNWQDWPYLGFGLAVIMLSHVLSAYIAVLFMAVVFIGTVWFLDNKKARIIAGIKAVFTFSAATLIFIGPFLMQEHFQRFCPPETLPLSNAPTFNQVFIAMLRNSMTTIVAGNIYTVGFVGLVIIICGFISYCFLNETERFCLIMGALLVLCTSTIMPLNLLDKTFIGVIQFTFRGLGIASFLLAIVGGKVAWMFVKQYCVPSGRFFRLVLLFVLILAPWWATMRNFRLTGYQVANDNLIQQQWHLDQYAPVKSIATFSGVRNHVAIINGHKKTLDVNKNIHSIPNGLVYDGSVFTNARTVDLPVPVYQNERVRVNGKITPYQVSRRNTVKLTGTRMTANTRIKVYYQPSIFDYCAMIISLITWLGGAGLLVIKKISWHKKNRIV